MAIFSSFRAENRFLFISIYVRAKNPDVRPRRFMISFRTSFARYTSSIFTLCLTHLRP